MIKFSEEKRKIKPILTRQRKSINITNLEKIYEKIKDIPFFKKLIEQGFKHKLYDLISDFKFKNYQKNKIIFKEFSVSENLFIIIKGEILILKKTNKNLKNNFIEPNLFKKLKKIPFFYNKEKKMFFHKLINKKKNGNIFGKEIINNEKRKTTTITSTDCEFFLISKSIFHKIMKKNIFSKIDGRFDFFKKFLKRNFPLNDILNISVFFNKIDLKENNYLYKENDNFENIYFLAKGSIVLEKKILKKIDKNDFEMFDKKNDNYNFINRVVKEHSHNYICGIKELNENLKKNYFSVKSLKKSTFYFINILNIQKCFQEFPNFKIFLFKKIEKELKNLNVI